MKAVVGDITRQRCEALVNAANGQGPMGSGVAAAIANACGQRVRDEVYRICKDAEDLKEGDCYISSSGDLEKRGVRAIYHAVTMRYPGSRSSLDTVGKAMRSVLDAAVQNNIKTIAFPGLGTGVGGLHPKLVASRMVSIAKKYSDKIDVTFVDIDKSFIDFVTESMDRAKTEGDGHEQVRSNGFGSE